MNSKNHNYLYRYAIFLILIMISINGVAQTYIKTYLTYQPSSYTNSCTTPITNSNTASGCSSVDLVYTYTPLLTTKSGPALSTAFPATFTQTAHIDAPIVTDAVSGNPTLKVGTSSFTFPNSFNIPTNTSFPPSSGTPAAVNSPYVLVGTYFNSTTTLTLNKNINVGTTGLTVASPYNFGDPQITGTTTVPAYTAPTSFSGSTVTPSNARFLTSYYFVFSKTNNLSSVLSTFPNVQIDTTNPSLLLMQGSSGVSIGTPTAKQVSTYFAIEDVLNPNNANPLIQPYQSITYTAPIKLKFVASTTTANGSNVFNLAPQNPGFQAGMITLKTCPTGDFQVSSNCLNDTNKTITFNVDSDENGSYDLIVKGGTWSSSNPAITLDTTNALSTGVIGINASAIGTSTITFTSVDGCTFTYNLTISNSGACSSTDSDGDGIADSIDLDDDNDGILDTSECTNILKQAGFDNITGLANGNNVGVSISPWVLGPGDQANVVQVDGAGGYDYGTGGPYLDANPASVSGSPQHYLDIVGTNSFYQSFTIAYTTSITYSGYFSPRDNLTGSGSLSIYTGSNGISGTLVDTTGSVSAPTIGGNSSTTPWTKVTKTVTLAPGTYSFVGTMNNDTNFDEGAVIGCWDTDGDGTPDYLDLDSDNDGCPDAVEGGDNVTQAMLNGSNAIGTNASGVMNSPAIATVDANGVPTIVNTGSTYNVSQAQGQTVGSAYTTNPAANAGTVSANQTIIFGTTPTAVSLTGSSGTVQWQSSTDNITFTNISGATSTSYSPSALTATTYYRAVLTNAGGCTVNSNIITVNVTSNLDAVNDTYSLSPGTSTASVIANDVNNGGTAAVIGTGAGQVSIRTSTDAAGTAGAWPAGFTLNADGTIAVASGTAAGTYTLYYTICNQTAGSPCDTAAVILTVSNICAANAGTLSN